jgi:glyoxylase-like metal-dependent hydrolase (beta-lactamase superfamily II)
MSDGAGFDVPLPEAWHGGQVSTRAHCVLAPNPGPMTLDGTNTWVLLEPGSTEAVVIDPGPDDEPHLRAVLALVEGLAAHVSTTLLTHGHADHSEGAVTFSRLSGSAVRALDAAQRLGSEGLGEGDSISAGGLDLRVVATPGHTSDSLSFLLPGDGAVLTGDTVLGRGTTVVAHPDGRLDDYLQSLDRLRLLAAQGRVTSILPGHGPPLSEALQAIEHYLAHREQRLRQVHTALLAGARTAREVVERVYADVDRSLWPAAELSVRAQLDYLDENNGPLSWRR